MQRPEILPPRALNRMNLPNEKCEEEQDEIPDLITEISSGEIDQQHVRLTRNAPDSPEISPELHRYFRFPHIRRTVAGAELTD